MVWDVCERLLSCDRKVGILMGRRLNEKEGLDQLSDPGEFSVELSRICPALPGRR